jgi:hypothetical protein
VEPYELNPYERELGPEEFEAKLARALADEADRASIRELIAWFWRRYPDAASRLAYARRKVRQLEAARPASSR